MGHRCEGGVKSNERRVPESTFGAVPDCEDPVMSDGMFQLILLAGLASIPVALAGVALLSRGRFLVMGIAIAVGLVCAIPGYTLGVNYFCSANDAGNLCGFAAAFGTAPLCFCVGAIGSVLLSRRWLLSKKVGGSS